MIPSGPPMTNSTGSAVASSVPKKGTTTAIPVNTANVSAYGTFSTYSPIAVSVARKVIARSRPTM